MLFGGAAQINIALMLTSAIVLLIAMTIHEVSHNYVGYWMGDPTPRDLGRLTFNPLVHINWIGWLMWVVIGFGILGSAPISEHRMRDRRWGYLLAVAAGPFSNLALAIIVGILFRFGLWQYAGFGPRDVIPNFNQLMTMMFQLNLLLFIFNLLPVFPFDGWHILRKLLPPQQAYYLERYQQESMYIFLGLIVLQLVFRVPILWWVIGPPMQFLSRVLLGL